MERADCETKLPGKSRGEMKIVAKPRKPPVVIPVVVVAVDVHVPLVVPAIERSPNRMECLPRHHPSNILRTVSYPAS